MSDPISNQPGSRRLFDPRQADALYKPIPTFAEWAATPVQSKRWERYRQQLKGFKNVSKETLQRAYSIVRRAAAIDTGAIEGLYEVDRGFTFTVAMQSALWEERLHEKGAEVRRIIETQIEVYDYLLDFATGKQPIAQAWIREIHKQITAGQATYRALTEVGWQEYALPRGEYKSLPNHVVAPDDTIHSYAPVEMVATEMRRLCQEFESPEFLNAHPVLQAAYAHYAFVCIHPFADGNGRVARALASVFTYRTAQVPILILAEHRPEYLQALRAADSGDATIFVKFILERTLDSMELVQASIEAAQTPPTDTIIQELDALYTTSGGYTHHAVDEAGQLFAKHFLDAIREVAGQYQSQHLSIRADIHETGQYPATRNNYRIPILGGGRLIFIQATTQAPASAHTARRYYLEVPKDYGADDDLLIRDDANSSIITARINDIVPTLSGILSMRLRLSSKKIIDEIIHELRLAAEENVRQIGYR
ncbi:MAG: Fic family protein [Chlorobi bacterium CHB2]|nr:Fic family protein [Chlorobi bacterium CHB2]